MKGNIYLPSIHNTTIQQIWEIKSEADDTFFTQTIPPIGVPEIIFFINKGYQIKGLNIEYGFIKGQYTKTKTIEFSSHYHLLGVRLQPYGLKQLFNLNAESLTNSVIDCSEYPLTLLLKNIVYSYNDVNIDMIYEIIRTLECHQQNGISLETLKYLDLVSKNNIKNITNILFEKGIGIRSLQRKFKNEVGISPKKYSQIVRMLAIENLIESSNDWFKIIEVFDFSDQSHLIKEFKSIRNNTPNNTIKKGLRMIDQLPKPKILKL